MKKILFMCINMNIGGTEKALLNMVAELPLNELQVTLLMLEEYGGFLEQIPKGVEIKYLNDFQKLKPLLNQPSLQTAKQLFSRGKIVKAISLAGVYGISKFMKERSLFFKYILRQYPMIEETYDLVVAYAGPMEFITYFMVNKVSAKKKVQWIHFDITKIGFNIPFAKRVYSKLDKIFVVSEEGREKLIKCMPELKDRTEVFYNMVSTQLVHKQSKAGQGFIDDYAGIRILTVGRLSQEKGQDRCIEALKRLKDEGYLVRWYVIGEGSYKNQCEQMVKQMGLEEDFIFLGARANPYPYMKTCDLYVQSSRHEGYCITLAEARCFNQPIITTDFTGAHEQVRNGETGLVVSGSGEAIYQAVKKLLDDKKLFHKIARNLEQEEVEQINEIDKLYKLLED